MGSEIVSLKSRNNVHCSFVSTLILFPFYAGLMKTAKRVLVCRGLDQIMPGFICLPNGSSPWECAVAVHKATNHACFIKYIVLRCLCTQQMAKKWRNMTDMVSNTLESLGNVKTGKYVYICLYTLQVLLQAAISGNLDVAQVRNLQSQ